MYSKFALGIMIGFGAGLLFAVVNWYGSPKEFNERNANNIALQKCITVLEAAKTADKDHE